MATFNDFTTGLQAVMGSDVDLVAWAEDHFARAFTQVKGFRPIEVINAEQLPLQSLYLFGGEVGPLTLGAHSFDQLPDVIMEFIWTEPDPDAAMVQAEQLIDRVPIALGRNPTLSNAVGGCWVKGWQAGDPRNHPMHMVGFRISADYNVLTA